jgi:hypothetical protein
MHKLRAEINKFIPVSHVMMSVDLSLSPSLKSELSPDFLLL